MPDNKEKIKIWLGRASKFLKTDIIYTLKGGSFLTLGNIVSVIANFALAFFSPVFCQKKFTAPTVIFWLGFRSSASSPCRAWIWR